MNTIPLVKPDLPDLSAVAGRFDEILRSGCATNFGKYVTEFEKLTSEFLGVHVATTSSGTLGLVFSLLALGVGRGDKVAIPSFSFVATAQAVLLAGAEPVFVDIGEDLNLCPRSLDLVLRRDEAIKAVIPVHVYGLPCKVDEIKAVVQEFNAFNSRHIHIVYDSAHAFGAETIGGRIGRFGNAEVFSLSVTKTLTTIEGGLVASQDLDFIKRIKEIRNYGFTQPYNAGMMGANGKMSELHAVIGIENLGNLQKILDTRFSQGLKLMDLIRSKTALGVISIPEGVRHTFKDFTVILPSNPSKDRDAFMKRLKERNLDTKAYFFPPIHRQSFFSKFADGSYPITDDLSQRVLTIPFFTDISDEQLQYIADQLHECWESLG